MAYIQRLAQRLVLAHNVRREGKVQRVRLHTFAPGEQLTGNLQERLEKEHPGIAFDWEQLAAKLASLSDPTMDDPTDGDPTGSEPTLDDPTRADPTGHDPTPTDPTALDPTSPDPITTEPLSPAVARAARISEQAAEAAQEVTEMLQALLDWWLTAGSKRDLEVGIDELQRVLVRIPPDWL